MGLSWMINRGKRLAISVLADLKEIMVERV